jgi:hypothetical protein
MGASYSSPADGGSLAGQRSGLEGRVCALGAVPVAGQSLRGSAR